MLSTLLTKKKPEDMLTDTPICNFGWKATEFTLKDLDGKVYSLKNQFTDKGH